MWPLRLRHDFARFGGMRAAMQALEGRRILLVIGGGIAAYKVLELIRRLKERGAAVRAVLTKSAHHFVTPLSISAITGERVGRTSCR